MLTKTYRPSCFVDLKGEDLPKRVLSKIAREPLSSPKAIILSGGRGLGKTSSARIFARAVNCEKKTGDCCNTCNTCKSISSSTSALYMELDSAITGNVDQMRNMRDTFAFSVQSGFRVIVFDECHLVSRTAQSALLTVLEEPPKGVFFILATTNPEQLLPTIISRSLVLEYEPLPEQDVVSHLREVADKEGISVADSTLIFMARRSRGHMRDAVQQVEMLKLLGEETFVNEIHLLDQQFEALFVSFTKRTSAIA